MLTKTRSMVKQPVCVALKSFICCTIGAALTRQCKYCDIFCCRYCAFEHTGLRTHRQKPADTRCSLSGIWKDGVGCLCDPPFGGKECRLLVFDHTHLGRNSSMQNRSEITPRRRRRSSDTLNVWIAIFVLNVYHFKFVLT